MKEVAPRVVVDESVAFGKPVIRGTRVPVELLVSKMKSGMDIDQVAREYEAQREDVLAALSYSARSSRALNLRERLVVAEEDAQDRRILSEEEVEAEIARWFREKS